MGDFGHCPFCDSVDLILGYNPGSHGYSNSSAWVRCKTCLAQGPVVKGASDNDESVKHTAVEKWRQAVRKTDETPAQTTVSEFLKNQNPQSWPPEALSDLRIFGQRIDRLQYERRLMYEAMTFEQDPVGIIHRVTTYVLDKREAKKPA